MHLVTLGYYDWLSVFLKDNPFSSKVRDTSLMSVIKVFRFKGTKLVVKALFNTSILTVLKVMKKM